MAQANAFIGYLAEVKPLIEERLIPDRVRLGVPSIERDLDAYLYRPYDRFVSSGGKRTRPALCLLCCEAVGGARETALPLAAAIEHFQAAALIHDDIADEGTTRRGNPCMYLTEGVGLAVNAGDLGLVSVIDAVMRDMNLAPMVRLGLIEDLVAMEEYTLQGQALDLGWVRDGRWDISEEDYLHMAQCKTAYYTAAIPLSCGADIGGGTSEQSQALFGFGLDAGLAFQLQDDLMNLVGDEAAQGKDFRSDITEGKRTLVAVKALASLDPTARVELLGILSAHETDPDALGRAVELFRMSGALDYVREYALMLVERAKGRLEGADLDPHAVGILCSMADFFVDRSS